MQYTYCFMNATLALRVIYFLLSRVARDVKTVTVIYLIDRWVLDITLEAGLSTHQNADFKAFLDETGTPYQPLRNLRAALQDLHVGHSPTTVMNRYQVVVVSHGAPDSQELEMFRQQFIEGLGYCPQSLI